MRLFSCVFLYIIWLLTAASIVFSTMLVLFFHDAFRIADAFRNAIDIFILFTFEFKKSPVHLFMFLLPIIMTATAIIIKKKK
jgi:hypothetical protein